MSEMIERVARAIDPSLWVVIDRLTKQQYDLAWVADSRRLSFDRAKAAVTAMREPTQLMVKVGRSWSDSDADLIFSKMIDAALDRPMVVSARGRAQLAKWEAEKAAGLPLSPIAEIMPDPTHDSGEFPRR
jgi:hypothetical protein